MLFPLRADRRDGVHSRTRQSFVLSMKEPRTPKQSFLKMPPACQCFTSIKPTYHPQEVQRKTNTVDYRTSALLETLFFPGISATCLLEHTAESYSSLVLGRPDISEALSLLGGNYPGLQPASPHCCAVYRPGVNPAKAQLDQTLKSLY
jgi:hypothetical protein